MSVHLKTVNFGSGSAGLATVGYTLYNSDGTVNTARSTSGVFEVGTSTGIYACPIMFPDSSEVILLWDTGTGSPRYAPDESMVQLNAIQEGTDRIRTIWNTLVNTGDLYTKLLKKIEGIKLPANKEYSAELKEILGAVKDIAQKEYPKIEEIKKALTVVIPEVKIPAPVVNIPKTDIPDYSLAISRISKEIATLQESVKKIPLTQKDYTANITALFKRLDTLSHDILFNLESKHQEIPKAENFDHIISTITAEMNKLKDDLVSMNKSIASVNSNITETMKPAKFLQEIYQILQTATELKSMSEEYHKRLEGLQAAGLG